MAWQGDEENRLDTEEGEEELDETGSLVPKQLV
jgi:hypothetical protein